jgi:hypothetical protein
MRSRVVYLSDGTTKYFLGDREVAREEFDAAFPDKGLSGGDALLPAHTPGRWPMPSEALAVHPSQVAEATERARKHGIGAEYLPDGTCVLASRGDRKKLLKLEGFRDNHGGYGD